MAKPPRPNHDRIIMHIDYDCFYAQVIENRQPSLKSLPLGIRQKSILATCNYEARRRGVRKLMLISEAKKICPDLVLANGEDLSPFRDVSKRLYALLQSYSWNKKIERLGLDELFLDVTDIVLYNINVLNNHDLAQSFFYLSAQDPERGFAFDATASFPGCLSGHPVVQTAHVDDSPGLRLLLASHLARYLRLRIEEEGYTSTFGISTNKLLSKLVGSRHKPRNQTTLLHLQNEYVLSFMDAHVLRKVPGIGSKTTRLLENHVLGASKGPNLNDMDMDCSVTVAQVRTHPDMSPALLERILGGPGAERGIGERVWGLLHGVDDTEVKLATDIPSQISIEDTYKGLNSLSEISLELHKICASLLRRMHVDLTDVDEDAETPDQMKWLAHPRTLRLTTQPKWNPSERRPYTFNRTSKSQPLPSFIFSFVASPESIVEKLVSQNVLPMFQMLNPDHGDWNIGLLNVCVANMALAGTNKTGGNGRDISVMFRKQDEVLRDFRVDEEADETDLEPSLGSDMDEDSSASDGWVDAVQQCEECGHSFPLFAVGAHKRYHQLGD